MNERQRLGLTITQSVIFALLVMVLYDYKLSDSWMIAITAYFVIGNILLKL